MMPLTMANEGESVLIVKVGGRAETRQFLEHLGFVPGESVEIVTQMGGNVIVKIKGARVAINREMAGKIMI